MSRRGGGRGERIRNAAALLGVMGKCRDTLIEAQRGVEPFGVSYHGCGMVVAAIDALAKLMTGQPHYYSITSSVGPSTQRPPGE